MHRSKTKEKVLFSTSHQQEMDIHFLGSRASVFIVIVLEDNHINNEYSHLLHSLRFFFLLAMTSYGMDYPFGQFGSALLAVSPSSPHQAYSPVGMGWGWREPGCCGSNAEQELKHLCVLNTSLDTATKQSTTWAAEGKVPPCLPILLHILNKMYTLSVIGANKIY